MNILHLYPENDTLITRHVNMLGNGVTDAIPDIVHIHGCWQYKTVRRALQAHRQGARIVFTPHGGLEPWIMNERRYSEKLCKSLIWQKRLAQYSYVIIAQGSMEAKELQALNWNPRIEIIRNAVITNSITPEAMARQTQDVYRKVLDSNTISLMSEESIQLLKNLLKAGITGDRRWVSFTPQEISEEEWRRLLVYADHENVRAFVDAGLHHMGIAHPYIETSLIHSYLPTDYQQPKVKAIDINGIVQEIHQGHVTLRHFVELDKALRHPDVNEEWLIDGLAESQLLKYFRRLLQIVIETTGLDEGFWPVTPINDRITNKIRKQLNNHLRI